MKKEIACQYCGTKMMPGYLCPECGRITVEKKANGREFRYFVHDGARFVNEHYATCDQYADMLKRFGDEAKKALIETGAAHAIYAVATTKDGVKELDLYYPAVTLDDDEFDRRTDAQVEEHPDSIIYALHRGTAI